MRKIYSIGLEPELRRALDEIARIEDRTGADVVRRLLKKYAAKYRLWPPAEGNGHGQTTTEQRRELA